jgi:hypothetical protein
MKMKRKYPFDHQAILREGEPVPVDHWMHPEFEYWVESVVGTKIEVTREEFKSFAEAVMAEVEQPATTKE